MRRLDPSCPPSDRLGGLTADVLHWMGVASRALDGVDPGPMRRRVDDHGYVTPRAPRRSPGIVVATGWGRSAGGAR